MEIKNLMPTAEVEFKTSSGTTLFTVKYAAPDQVQLDYLDREQVSEKIRAVLMDAIVGWNLAHDDGTPWPCTPEIRAQLVPQLCGEVVKEKTAAGKAEQLEEGSLLGLSLLAFVTDEKNFLKN